MNSLRNKRILITGGAGFIGSALAHRLANENSVIIYDNFNRNFSIKESQHSDIFSIIKGDVTDYQLLEDLSKTRALENIDIIIHCAAICGIDTVEKYPTKTMEVNLLGTANLLKIAIKKEVEQFIYFSTSEVFGTSVFQKPETSITEIGKVGELRWSYAVSKLAAEHLVRSYFTEFNLPITIIRPFNIYGPGQIGEGAIQRFISAAIQNKTIKIYGNGIQIRSWCYINDMVGAILLCLGKPDVALGEVFNIGNPRATLTILELAQRIKQLSNSESKIVFIPKKNSDVELRVPNIEKAGNLLGYIPVVDLNEGILKTIQWYKKNIWK